MVPVKRERSPSVDNDDGLFVSRRPQMGQSRAARNSRRLGLCSKGCAARTVLIDEDGDLYIIAGQPLCSHLPMEGAASDFEVRIDNSSAFQVKSSMVFERSAEFTSAFDTEDLAEHSILRLDEDWAPMATLLHILHAHYKKVSSANLGIKHIYEVAVLAEKYNLLPLLHPCLGKWKPVVEKAGLFPKAFALAWIFGDKKTFQSSLRSLAYNREAAKGVTSTDENPSRFNFPTFEVPDVHRAAGALRLEVLKEVLEPLQTSISDLLLGTSNTSDGIICQTKQHKPDSDCNMMLLGSLLKSLVRVNLWPIPNVDTYDGSAGAVIQKFRLLKLACPRTHEEMECNRVVHGPRNIPYWMNELPEITLTEAQKEHLDAQAEKTGWAHV